MVETTTQQVSCYINDFKLAIQDQVRLQYPYKVNDAYQLAVKVEAQFNRGSSQKSRPKCTSAIASKTNNITQGGQRTIPARTNGTCGKTIQTHNNAQGKFFTKCYRCAEFGH